jgi:hypothetical protein
MAPSGVNDSAREVMASVRTWYEDAEWINFGYTHTYAAATQFTIASTDVTGVYVVGRRVRAVGSSTGTIYGTITASVFSTNTTVTVSWDSGTLQNESLTISLGIAKCSSAIKSLNIAGIAGELDTAQIADDAVTKDKIIDTFVNSLTAITTLQDADQFIVADNSDSDNHKKITLANLVAALGTGLVGFQVLTTSGTYTATSGATTGLAIAIGGGGGGGGSDASSTGLECAAGGGAGGGCAIARFAISGTVAYTIGAGGSAGSTSGGDGGTGGTTTFTGVAVATGGAGGTGTGASAGDETSKPGGLAGVGTTGDVLIGGQDGGNGTTHNDSSNGGIGGSAGGIGGGGGRSGHGQDSDGTQTSPEDGNVYGGGGGGAAENTGTGTAGGAGAAGVILVLEFA